MGNEIDLHIDSENVRNLTSQLILAVEAAHGKRKNILKNLAYTKDKLKKAQREKDHLLDLMLEISPQICDDMTSSDESADLRDPFNYNRKYSDRADFPHVNADSPRGSFNLNNDPKIKPYQKREPTKEIQTSRKGFTGDREARRESTQAPPPVKKRKRIQNKENRLNPKPVKVLPEDSDGKIILPAIVGTGADEITVYNLGKVVPDREGFHTSLYIFPVGFHSSRMYPSVLSPKIRTKYTSTILDGPSGPVFRVVSEDMADTVYTASSASAAWKIILEKLVDLGVPVKVNTSGPQLFGLSNLSIVKAIQELPSADECVKYIRYSWITTPASPHSPNKKLLQGTKDSIMTSNESLKSNKVLETPPKSDEKTQMDSLTPVDGTEISEMLDQKDEYGSYHAAQDNKYESDSEANN